jgi:chemotaxis protein methyltransferase CheR
MTSQTFAFFSDLVRRRSGMALAADRLAFVESRLTPVALRHGFRSAAELVDEVADGPDTPLCSESIAALATHDSAFFRDEAPFETLRRLIVPELLRTCCRTRKIRIWSAGASTGQEPYSLAMLIEEMPELAGWDVSILATDLDAGVIARAEAGLFSEFDVQRGLPVAMLAKYFRRERGGWRVLPSIRARVRFRVLNLLESFAGLGPFEVTFCRNVLIYFDPATKDYVLARLSGVLADEGYLVLGAADVPNSVSRSLSPLAKFPGIYWKHGRPRTLSAA